MAEEALLACQALAAAVTEKSDDPSCIKRPMTREEHVSKVAQTMIQCRERLGHRLNLVKYPNGTPLVTRACRCLTMEEMRALRYT